MTPAEINRAIASKKRVEKIKQQEKAALDYIQAGLISKGVLQAFAKGINIPKLTEAYSSLFDEKDKEAAEQQLEAQKENIFAIKLKQYAQAHNDKLRQQEALFVNE